METPEFPGVQTALTGPKLRLVRYAMLVMLLVFGGVAYYTASSRPPEDAPTADLATLRMVGYALCAAAIVAVAVLRQRREAAAVEARPTLGLIGSAFAESSALFGAVFILLGGDVWIYAFGLLVFLGTWSLLPADSEAE